MGRRVASALSAATHRLNAEVLTVHYYVDEDGKSRPAPHAPPPTPQEREMWARCRRESRAHERDLRRRGITRAHPLYATAMIDSFVVAELPRARRRVTLPSRRAHRRAPRRRSTGQRVRRATADSGGDGSSDGEPPSRRLARRSLRNARGPPVAQRASGVAPVRAVARKRETPEVRTPGFRWACGPQNLAIPSVPLVCGADKCVLFSGRCLTVE